MAKRKNKKRVKKYTQKGVLKKIKNNIGWGREAYRTGLELSAIGTAIAVAVSNPMLWLAVL